MKNQRHLFTLSAIVLFGLTSCVKQVDLPADNANTTNTSVNAENFSQIKASDNFNWSTSRKINFAFNGATNGDYQLVLKVTDPEGNVVLQKLQNASENFSQSFELPSRFENVTVSYGSTSQKLDCKNGSVTMSIN